MVFLLLACSLPLAEYCDGPCPTFQEHVARDPVHAWKCGTFNAYEATPWQGMGEEWQYFNERTGEMMGAWFTTDVSPNPERFGWIPVCPPDGCIEVDRAGEFEPNSPC